MYSGCIRNTWPVLQNRRGRIAVIYLAQPGQMEKDIAKLEEVMAEYNEGRAEELRLSLAYGYEEQMWSGEEYFLRKMIRFADEKMYEDKRRKHGCREHDNECVKQYG